MLNSILDVLTEGTSIIAFCVANLVVFWRVMRKQQELEEHIGVLFQVTSALIIQSQKTALEDGLTGTHEQEGGSDNT